MLQTIRTALEPKPRNAIIAATGFIVLPTSKAQLLYRTVVHESAHAIEAKVSGANVDRITISYNPIYFLGQTEVSQTTPQSALGISLAGVGADIGFILGSIIMKRISIKLTFIWLALDVASFLFGKDYSIYLKAKKHIERGKENHA